jgi:phosphomethylpyrimidine synthase
MSISKLDFKDSAYLDGAFPASERIYIPGKVHASVRVPLREISTKDQSRLRVYDTRGPWGDPRQICDVRHGLPALRLGWIADRGDTVEYEGRQVRPEDNGYLSLKHAATARAAFDFSLSPACGGTREKPSRAVQSLNWRMRDAA